MPKTIEDIILDRDRRGIAALRPHLPEETCGPAARLILENPGTAVIVTGFYIMSGGATETDGPPGALAIGRALEALGYEAVYVTDRHTAPIMSTLPGPVARIVDFPITDDEASKRFADELLDELTPSVLVAIERCGLSSDGLYRNMRDRDMTAFTARTDHLFYDHPHTVGIGDGGNEIGMGAVASVVPTVPTLVKMPCVTSTTQLIISSVSNWGGYGLVAALSREAGRVLLPSVKEERALVERMVDLGAVDGSNGEQAYRVDGFTLEENSQALEQLHQLLAEEGIPA